MTREQIDAQITEILNEPRSDCFYAPDPTEPITLETLKAYADEGVLNGPEGNDAVLRLHKVIVFLTDQITSGPR